MTSDFFSSRDERTVWHPYTQHGWKEPRLPVIRAKGAYLTLEDGREILDAISSWWVNLHGHSHPKIASAIADQAATLEHVLFAGFTHPPAVDLAERLLSIPSVQKSRLSRVFYSDNGSTAVEVALKMAYQFQRHRGRETRTRFLALRGSYHGDTLGAMSVSDSGFESLFRPLLGQVDFVSPGDTEDLEVKLGQKSCPYAAFIFEPCVQGAGGMALYDPKFLKRAVDLCRQHEVLSIADEVFTGFYRTGKFFAFEHAGILPDLVCISKGITGGFMALSATLAPEWLFEIFLDPDLSRAFLHGHSYTANPIACAAAVASFDLLMQADTQQNIARIVDTTKRHVEILSAASGVEAAWTLGTIGAIRLRSARKDYFAPVGRQLRQAAIEHGVLLRPLGTVLYGLPPYCTQAAELEKTYTVMADLAARFAG